MAFASELGGGAKPERRTRATAKLRVGAFSLRGAGGGMMEDNSKVTGIDNVEVSKCHTVARRVAEFGAARCANVAVVGESARAGRAAPGRELSGWRNRQLG